ncbi:MAG TPA: capsule assembly Wzi family protein [Candidatus Angelobacter sp.]|nr:capsule assembly Wzi family protein [Candidatus Angelobacter sp.]
MIFIVLKRLRNSLQTFTFLLVLSLAMGGLSAISQTSSTQQDSSSSSTVPAPPADRPDNLHEATAAPAGFVRNMVFDQKNIWTSPFKLRVQDANWLVPLAGLTAGAINADSELSSRVSPTGTFSRHANTISNGGLAAALGGAGGLYLVGKLRSDDHEQESGILAGEAAANSLIVAEVLKFSTQRQRPLDGSGQGKFFASSSLTNSAFPSNHAILAWAVASVISHEYPGIPTQILTYGGASVVSLARVYGKDHFPSDVIVGSVLGWMIGRQIYASHHDAGLPGGGWGTFHHDPPEHSSSESRFSPYVPLDSWVYPAFDRLIALGAVQSQLQGLRPWTRAECSRLLQEAEDAIADSPSGDDEVSRLYHALAKEFAPEIAGDDVNYLSLDSVYARATGISGKPLTDGYHFGQTIVNDFGRPFHEGVNGLSGFSASGSSGALGFYVRGEYEHSPSAPAISNAVQRAIETADQKPQTNPLATPTFNQFRLLDSYITLNLSGWQASFGKQSLWLGPTQDPFLQSDNAEPLYMFRVDQTTPRTLPGIFKFLGEYRSEFWVGKLTGQHFINTQDGNIAVTLGRSLADQPLLNGVKFNFKPTPNFEFGVGRTGLWGGPNFPITLGTTKNSFFSQGNAEGRLKDPGDRRSTFDFSYRIPGLRNWLTLYEDSFVEDEISPIGYPRRAAHNPGVYLSHLPGVPHLDLRVESAFTNLPGLLQGADGFFYWNVRYLDGYTNKGNILGNATVGRRGVAFRAQSTYWFASDKTIQAGFRSNYADGAFVGGGDFRDAFLRSEWSFRHNVSLSGLLQYEWWDFPILSLGNRVNNVTASLQLTYWPHWRLKGSDAGN